MTRILVVWEDRYFETLGPFVKKRVAAHPSADPGRFPELLFHTANGASNFKRYVSSTWPSARAKGLPRNPGVIDHLVCVVDGDKAHEQIEGVAKAPAQVEGVGPWLETAESTWQSFLHAQCGDAPKATVHGRILRWCKESLVLAGYDREAAKRRLHIDARSESVKKFLAECKPSPPPAVPDQVFTSTFRKPLQCLVELDKAQRASPSSFLGKNSPELDDALRDLAREDPAVVAERVPELDRLADLVWQLVSPVVPAPLVPPTPAAPAHAGAAPRKQARKTPKR